MAKADEKKLTAVRVAARPDRGFNCAGRFWPGTPTDAEVDEPTLKRIEKESALVVVRFPPGTKLEKPAETKGEGDEKAGEGGQTPPPASTKPGERGTRAQG